MKTTQNVFVRNRKLCTGCGACVYRCKYGALSIGQDENGFYKVKLDFKRCVECGECVGVCPLVVRPSVGHYEDPKLYCFMNHSEDAQQSATAGGFKIVAEKMLDMGAVVVGAAWNEKWECVYELAESREVLSSFLKSKYVQSKTDDIYRRVEERLKSGISVLFSGLPCHVAGLYAYLGRDYDNLYTIDLLCNNVPSIKVFHRFLEESYGLKNVKHVDCRYKAPGKTVKAVVTNVETDCLKDTSLAEPNTLYFRAFVARMLAGTHCENCKFASLPRLGDITLGDIYGAEKVDARFIPLYTESMLVNSIKGQYLAKFIRKECCDFIEVPIDVLKDMHPVLCRKWPVNPHRDVFYEMLGKFSFEKTCKALLDNHYDVGIVGVATNLNYGGALTYFALKKKLEELGKTSLMILPPGNDLVWLPKRIKNFRKNPYEEHEIISCPTKSAMKALNEHFDVFMDGSDQLFSTHFPNIGIYGECDEFASLDWVLDSRKKVAYGASFGRDEITAPLDIKQRMGYYIKKFDSFAVREKSAVKLCEEEFGIKAKWVLDPVFLLERQRYRELASVAMYKKAELFAYVLDSDEDVSRVIADVRNEREYSLASIGDSVSEGKGYVEDWLASVINADFIVTDSYHGMCFAVMFNIPFIVWQNNERGSARYSLLNELGLDNRLIVSYDDYLRKKDILLVELDWAEINSRLEKLRAYSLNVLSDQLVTKKKVYSDFDILDAKIDYLSNRISKLDFLEIAIRRTFNSLIGMIGDEECIIFGTGDFGKRCREMLISKGCNIKYYIDNNANKHGKIFMGKKVYPPQKLWEEEKCVVLVASFDYADEMKKQLDRMKLNKGIRIIFYMDLGDVL